MIELILFIMQIAVAVFYVGYLVNRYAMQQVSIQVNILVYLTWLLSFSIVFLLPYDIYSSLKADYTMSIVWRSIYFAIFFLTWVLLPIAQEYQCAGEFNVKDKLKRAIINNLIIYGIFAALGAVFLAYLIIRDKFSIAQLMPILMAVSNAFGMFLVVIFLSYGLVAVPRGLWRQRQYEVQLKQKQFSITTINKKKNSITYEFELKIKEVLWMKQKYGQTPQINYILNLIPEKYLKNWQNNVPDLGQINIIKSHKIIKELLLELNRLQSKQEQTMFQAFKIQDILASTNDPSKCIESIIMTRSQYGFINYAKWVWYCRLKTLITPVLAVIFTLFAFAIIIAQSSVFIHFISFFNPFNHIINISSFILLDIALLIVLFYIVFCVYYALFKLKFSNYYGLYWNKQTDVASLIFYAMYDILLIRNCSRISNPLGYNFLQIINDKNTSFSQVMGEANMVPVFGQTFYILFPLLLIILILFNALDIYSKLAKIFKLQKFQFEAQFNHENIEQGQKWLQRKRSEVEMRILNSNSKDLREYKSYQSQVPLNRHSLQKGTDCQFVNKKDSTSSDSIKIKHQYYNGYPNMEDMAKIMQM